MNKSTVLLIIAALLSGCTSMQVAELDPTTGYFPTKNKAAVVTDQPIDLDSRKSLIVVGNSEFAYGQIVNIGYFDEVITTKELETRIVREGLSDKVPTLAGKIGMHNAAKAYKPFLWLNYDSRGTGREQYARFILTDAETMEDYFITETHMDHVWSGVNDQSNWYPMFNALIDYIRMNSETYGK